MNSATEVFEPLRADDPSTVAGYRIAARLGAGGMGRVYLSHTQGGRPVAIKVVRPELAEDPAFRRRFRREVEAARRVRGAYTAELIDADADATPPWLATLYVPGPSLSQAVARRGPLPLPAVLWLTAGVAEALQAIHGAGIVHRDLKPSNVLLAADGPRVIDFGISLASDTTAHTATGATIGTPQYMSPEQASAGEVTAAADVFALGQTAAFAALGEPLYGTGPSATVLYRIVHSEPDLSRLPQELRPLIARCLATDPRERATPAEIVAWCRTQLGEDADADGGPALWREVTGPEPTVPEPLPEPVPAPTPELVPAPTPSAAPVPGSPHTMRQVWQPPQLPEPAAPEGPEQRRKRRRRTALLTAASVTVVAVLLGGLWVAADRAADGLRDRAKSPTPGGTPAGGARSASGDPARGAAGSASKPSQNPSQNPSPSPSPSASAPPRAIPYPGLTLNEENSVGIKEPVQRANRAGDLRLDCEETGCRLESDTSVISLLSGEPHGSLDSCRTALGTRSTRSQSLSQAAAGSELCVKHQSGDIALLVLTLKSTPWMRELPGSLRADMTVWRAA
ncbi:serine/threonine-protein kinase [Streptomyces xanthophaeus]|uniref:serine/threonine-protein kinase n=1 Tax=Streptomyces xanthophaeus TaxID=67385 RepID=UPI002649431A|nr:serine/threonine-protein kinase [Streptomyces xanthophaeus]WKD34603.1 serine/threonine protein kinase [Streptomyces xanthophaeus]